MSPSAVPSCASNPLAEDGAAEHTARDDRERADPRLWSPRVGGARCRRGARMMMRASSSDSLPCRGLRGSMPPASFQRRRLRRRAYSACESLVVVRDGQLRHPHGNARHQEWSSHDRQAWTPATPRRRRPVRPLPPSARSISRPVYDGSMSSPPPAPLETLASPSPPPDQRTATRPSPSRLPTARGRSCASLALTPCRRPSHRLLRCPRL